MTERGAATVYTIPPCAPFVDRLAEGIMARVGRDPLDLAAVTVLLPTRRACRSLRDAFLRQGGGQPLLLPRLFPLGDLDPDALSIEVEEVPGMPGALDVPEAIPALRRQLVLAQLVLKAEGMAATTAQAMRLGADLGRLLDQVATERASFDRLERLVPEDYAEHWQVTLKFLRIITAVWPALLADWQQLDPAARRNALMEAQAALWAASPPPGIVIAAGSTGSIPAAADLLAVIARMPQGMVVLPGLDQTADDATWDAVLHDEAHPQHELCCLLRRMGVDRHAVRLWDEADAGAERMARSHLAAEAMRPAATTESWRNLNHFDGETLKGLTRVDAAGPEEEAAVIALMMREALETPGRTAALVTPDRNLARRVASVLQRWRIAVDDSSGRPLGNSAVGTYLRLAAEVGATCVHPLDLLALAKHPMAAGGWLPFDFRASARALERIVLRGPRPGPGFAGLRAALDAADPDDFDHPDQRAHLSGWIDAVEALAAPFLDLLDRGTVPLRDLIETHARFAESLAASDTEPGPERLWKREDGEAAARFLNDLRQAAADFPAVPVKDYPALFEALMAGCVVRPLFGLHPRLAILGPMEARLQHFDLTILGGLNEKSWPPDAEADPWMSRPMRKDFGLPSPERMIGLSAHDFAQCLGAPEVVLTRSQRVEGTPTVPSRWLLRLETVLKALKLEKRLEAKGEKWLAWARSMDEPAAVQPIRPPEPRPPVSARPRRLSVTRIETWMRDPYAIYAHYVLRLKRLDPIAADPGAADKGQFIHAALERFIRDTPGVLPGNALAHLLDAGREAFGPMLHSHPDVWAFWWPRFERLAAWVVERERDRRRTIKPLAVEVPGRLVLAGPAGPFELTAKADRIDRDNSADGAGRLVIIDYKTGLPPSASDVALGFAPQLPLEAAIARAGGFEGVPAADVAALLFWRLSGGDPPGSEVPVKGDIADLADQALAGLEALIRTFDDPDTPYRSVPRPSLAPRYTDYAHLARVQEWSAGSEGSSE